MPVVINGTTGVSGVDGTAGTPAVQGTDTNTGMFFPAADTIAFTTNGTEDMRITPTGDVGIGTSSPQGILDARGDVYLGSTSSSSSVFCRSINNWNFSGLNVIRNASNTSTPRLIGMPLNGDDLASTTIGGYNAIWGIYNASPTTGSTSSSLQGEMAYGAFFGHRWYTNGTERARITSSGNLLVGTTSDNGARLRVNGNAYFDSLVYFPAAYNQTTSNPANAHIASDGNLFRSTSSIKYKTDVQNATHGLAEVMSLRPVIYKGKNDGDRTFGGLIAEEVHEVGLTEFVEYAEDGSPDALAYANMVSLAFKAIQELKADLDATKAELAALKAAQ